jgi:hypothetical protein
MEMCGIGPRRKMNPTTKRTIIPSAIRRVFIS